MKLRWIVLIAAASLIVALIVTVIYSVERTAAGFTPPPVNLDDVLSPGGRTFAPRLLAALGYNVKVHQVPFQRDAYSLIIRRWEKNDDEDAWETWLTKGKRLVLLCHTPEETARLLRSGSNHPLFRAVKNLRLNTDVSLDDFEFLDEQGDRETVLADEDLPLIEQLTLDNGADVVLIADNTLFGDRNLIEGDNAIFLNNCVKDYFRRPIAFDYSTPVAKSGGDGLDLPEGDSEPVFFLFRGNFLFVFLQLVLLGLVFLLVFWKRFGPPRDTEQFARRSLLRHLEATGNFFEKTSHPAVFIDILDRYFLARLRDLVRPAPSAGADLAAEVNKRLGASATRPRSGADAFSLKSKTDVAARDAERERIISRLKGVSKKHGQNKNPG